MFQVEDSLFMTSIDTSWYPFEGDFYVILIADHPAIAQETYYVKFHVVNGEEPPGFVVNQLPDPAYNHFIDWIGSKGV